MWLVFDLVIFWTAFPHAFTAVMNTLALPLWLALGGIVLRGAAFAFRREFTRLSYQRAAGGVFALSSLLTPFFMGTVVGAIAAGAVPADATHASTAAWTSPTALLAGFLFVAACGYLAAVYLVVEAGRRGDGGMRRYFTHRAQAAAVVAGALSLAAMVTLQNSDAAFYDRLTGRALPLVVVGGVSGLVVIGLLTIGWTHGARIIAALGVAAVIWGWGVAQYPVLLPGTTVTLTTAGATQATYVAIVVVAIAAVILVVPSFAVLFFLQGRRLLGGEEGDPALAAAAHPAHSYPGPGPGRARTADPARPAPRRPAQNQQASGAVRAAVIGVAAITALARRLLGH